LTYGSFWSDIFQVQLSNGLCELAENGALEATWLSFDGSVDTHPEEGAYLHRAENGWYYLFISHGIRCGYAESMPAPGAEYKIIYGRSKSPKGPFIDKNGVDMKDGGGTVILASHDSVFGSGGQGVLVDELNDVLYYHYIDTNVGYDDRDAVLGYTQCSMNQTDGHTLTL
jgi:arabinan endo-1,5-alpha-L-arabinosidase